MLLFSVGCATPVGVRRVDERTVQKTLSANILSTGEPSTLSAQVLRRLGLFERFSDEPEQVLAELHALTVAELNLDRLFALAEYSFLHASESEDRLYFVSAAIYAYAFLFPGGAGPIPNAFDSRFRTAIDLYNRGIAQALVNDAGEVLLSGGKYAFPLGNLEVVVDPKGFDWADRKLTNFLDAAELEVRGLRNRYRRVGIGAPFVATAVSEEGRTLRVENGNIPAQVKVPVTFFVRFHDARERLGSGKFAATIEIYSVDAALDIEVEGQRVPLEYETTSALAYELEGSKLWDFEIKGFRQGDFLPGENALVMLRPYLAGRIPIVLVHGTASSPARWAELMNELQSDERLSDRYQFWLFIYSTGNPVLYSASLLRDALRNVVAELDPEERDPALREMVLVGHSQGGLLVKAQAITSGNRFWENVSPRPFDEVELKPETRELIGAAAFFEPLPFVKRVVFISTPHRGSYLAGNWLGRIASNLATAPSNLVGTGIDLARAGIDLAGNAVDKARDTIDEIQGDEDEALLRKLSKMPSSVDNMNPNHRFSRTISSIPVDPGIQAHSIIPVLGDPPAEGKNDGVVEYTSAHIDEAVSEKIIYNQGHSTQSNPVAIQEVRRILLEHLDSIP